MASAFSLARNYSQFIPPVDLNFLIGAMQSKQQAYTQNFNATQEQINLIGNLDIAKDEDKAYLYDRVKTLVDSANQTGVDYSSTGVTQQISQHIKQALDKNTINAIAGTKKLRNYQAEVAQIKEKHPELYSTANEAYGNKEALKWLYDGKTGSKLEGNLTYTPYSDVQDKYIKLFDKISASRGDEVFQIPDGNGRIVERTFNGLKSEEIQYVVQQMMTPEEQRQLDINGWYSMGGNDKAAQNVFKQYAKQNVDEISGDIILTEGELKTLTKGTQKYVDAENKIKILKNNLIDYNLSDSEISKLSAEKIGAHFEKQKLIGGLQALHMQHLKSEKINKDDVYWEEKKYNLDVLKNNLATDQFNLEKLRFEYEKGVASGELNPPILAIPSPTDIDFDVNTVKSIITDISETQSTIDNRLDKYGKMQWGNDWDKVKKSIEARVEKHKLPDKDQTIFEELIKQNIGLRDGVNIDELGALLLKKKEYGVISKKLQDLKVTKAENTNIENIVKKEMASPYMGTTVTEQYLKVNPSDTYTSNLIRKNGKTTEDDDIIAKRIANWYNQNPNQKNKVLVTYALENNTDMIEENKSLMDDLKKAYGNIGVKNTFLVTPKYLKGEQVNTDYESLSRLAQAGTSPFDFDKKLDFKIVKGDGGYTISQIDDTSGKEVKVRSTKVDTPTFEKYASNIKIESDKKTSDKFIPISIPVPNYYSSNDAADVKVLMGNSYERASYVIKEDAKRLLVSKADSKGIEAAPYIDYFLNNASDIRISTSQSPSLSKGIKVNASIGKDIIGTATFTLEQYNALLERGFSNPQILLTSVLESELTNANNKEIPTNFKNINIQ